MVSVLQLGSVDASRLNRKYNNTSNNKSSIANSANINSNDLLMNFMTMVGRNNATKISFKGGQEVANVGWGFAHNKVNVPQACPNWLSHDNRMAIQAEASKRINGKYPWPKIDKVDAWMVSAETEKFMQVGGLGKVANDLPESFNVNFNQNEEKMTVVTPLYTNSRDRKLDLSDPEKPKYYYGKGFVGLKKVADVNVPIFDEWKDGGEVVKRPVIVYKATIGTTPYLMIHDPEVFNTDEGENNKGCEGCYVDNKFGYGENIRFAYFSKCVYELAKQLKNEEVSGDATDKTADKTEKGEQLKAPNVMIMNDWHVGSLAPLMKYMSVAEKEQNNLPEETAKYFNETPTVFIAHNLGYQGAISADKGTDRTKVLGTLFGEHAKTIVENSHSRDDLPEEDRNALFKYDAVNPGMMGLALADRVAPVSANYGEELLASPILGSGMQNLLKMRNAAGTFTPITNGLTKSLVVPTEANLKSWLGTVQSHLMENRDPQLTVDTSDIKLMAYDADTVKEGKAENKRQMFKLLNRIIEREQKESYADWNSLDTENSKKKYKMYRPNQTNLSDIEDPTKVPVMTFVGRVADQKGVNTIFKQAYLNFAREFATNPRYKDWEVPVVLVGGPPAETSIYKELEDFKNELRSINPKFADRFVLFKGFANTNLLSTASDFFLIPSKFEPCGLVQMEVMPKGVIPIATSTGGLVSTIRDQKDGFLSTAFYDGKDVGYGNTGKIMYVGTESRDIPTSNWQGYQDAMQRALHTFFKKPNKLEKMQKTAMQKDFSWDAQQGALEQYMTLLKEGKYEAKNTSYYDAPDEEDTAAYQN